MKARLSFLLYALRTLILVSLSAAYTPLPDEALKGIPRPGDDFNIRNGKLLSQILQPRVPGGPGSAAVLNHFAEFFGSELPEWTITYQNSSSTIAVLGNKEMPFVNMIATRDPPWSNPGEVGYLTLVAHYDSLMKPEGFIGAIDSAAPCAMLMHTAKSLEDALTKKWAGMVEAGDHDFEDHKGLQIILLDGEEAFDTWSDTDSIYGAKSLAAEMESTYHPALSTYHNALSTIHLFVLLDLLGSRNPKVPSYFKVTHWAYKKMADLEKRLRNHSLFESSGSSWFYDVDKSNDRWMGGMIGDDHVPFMARGVDVLHLIPSPFPPVWHKMSDDGEHLDMDTTEDWAVLVTAFAAEWMDLGNYMGVKSDHKRASRDDQVERIISKTELT
ncbi:hypothetical protein HO133_008387 [Letharia lupina]|uniref:Peptide hydrolase n=1 Tax=Letharia lupina TaxID=560253 RepID=A0A8H6CPG8_9LECA|nr:uncharacterized protein HO133_008387 [Letharia lupina]KAF6226946.1 hypothetical protein HO133_008387 [Letharia lupina]